MGSLATNYVTPQNNFAHKGQYSGNVPTIQLNGIPLKEGMKRHKKLPASISENDQAILTKVKKRAFCLDMGLFSCCGIRFGWSSAIGIVPGIGDMIDAMMAIIIIWTCQRIDGGLPFGVIMKMYLNIILDFGLGLVPPVGDVADALFRANIRNVTILEHHLRNKVVDEELGNKSINYRG